MAAVPLAACQQETTEESAAETGTVSLTNATPQEVARQAGAARSGIRLQPGQWETTTEVVAVDAPGLPEGGVKDQAMASLKGAPLTVKRCLTAAEAERPGAELFTGTVGEQCTYDRFEMRDGRIEAQMTCTGPQGETLSNRVRGSFTVEDFDLEVVTEGSAGPAAVSGLTVRMRSSGRRLGECAA